MPYETEFMHPTVAAILDGTGKSYIYECRAPISGVADFVVTLNRATVLVIECKRSEDYLLSSIEQVKDYARQFQALFGVGVKVIPWLVCRELDKGKQILECCRSHGVLLQTPFIDDWHSPRTVNRGTHKTSWHYYGINSKFWGKVCDGTDLNGKRCKYIIGKCIYGTVGDQAIP